MSSVINLEEQLKKSRGREERLYQYNKSIGLVLVYLLPLIIITVLGGVYILNSLRTSYTIIIILWVLYLLNTLAILLGASLTRKSFRLELKINRKNGLPFDSLEGFEVIKGALDKSLLLISIIGLVVFLSLSVYLIALSTGILPITYAATGLVFISMGLAILIKPSNYTTSKTMGLLDIWDPPSHPIYVNYIFTEFAQTFMDPPTVTKFDEYTEELSNAIKEGFSVEEAREKIFYCTYLLSNEVISKEDLRRELLEILNEDSYVRLIEDHEFFGIETMVDVVKKIQRKVPSFCRIVDRVQFNLMDNLSLFKGKEIYFDAAMEPEINGKKIDLVVLLFNNTTRARQVLVKVMAPECSPLESSYKLELVSRDFEIHQESLPLSSSKEGDVIEFESKILDLGDALWIPLTAKEFGEKRISIFLEDDKGNLIQGITLQTKLKKDTLKGLRKITGGGSMGAGIIVPLLKIMGSLPAVLSKLRILR